MEIFIVCDFHLFQSKHSSSQCFSTTSAIKFEIPQCIVTLNVLTMTVENHKWCVFPNLPVNFPRSYVLNLSCQSTNFLDNPFFNLLAYLHVHVAFTVNVNITFGDVFFEAPLVVESLHGNDYQIKSTLNSRTSKKECQILYMLNIIHLQFMSSFDEHLYA